MSDVEREVEPVEGRKRYKELSVIGIEMKFDR